MRAWLSFAFVAVILGAAAAHGAETTGGGTATVISIDGPIGPATSHYVTEAFAQARSRHARVIVLQLDTPGGLATSMRDIIKTILASPIPVIGYVAPSGARAASAGTYILYATDVAAMAPTTNLGAATPVPLMGHEKASSKMTAEQRKVLNDSIAYIRALATKHGRNADWAEKAVRHAASLPAEAALKKHVVDLIAPSTAALLQKVDGKQIRVNGKKSLVLHTRSLEIRTIEPDWRAEFLRVVTNPTLAYLLFLGGILGIVIEATHPGLIFPGVVGAICLLFALFAFQILPVNYAGIALILLGVGLMVAEAFVASFGSLGIGGVIAFVIGSVLLMNTHAPGFTIQLSVIIGVAVAIGIALVLLIGLAVRAHRRKVVSGAEEMIGSIALPVAAFTGLGQVRVHGEIWRARAPGAVRKNQRLRVVHMQGLTLDVEPVGQGEE